MVGNIVKLILGIVVGCFFINSLGATLHRSERVGVTLIEYYDYECPHCRKMDSVIECLQAQYPKLKVVYKVTPLLNDASKPVASFALAAKTQNQWSAVHRLLMQSRSSPRLADMKRIVGQLGLNTRQTLSAMAQASTRKQIEQNIHQAGHYAVHSVIYLPIMVFKSNHGQTIVLGGYYRVHGVFRVEETIVDKKKKGPKTEAGDVATLFRTHF